MCFSLNSAEKKKISVSDRLVDFNSPMKLIFYINQCNINTITSGFKLHNLSKTHVHVYINVYVYTNKAH